MPFQYDPKISFGNIVTICMVVVGALSAFIAVQYQVAELDRRVAEASAAAQERVARYEMMLNSYESRVRAVEIAQASQTSDLRSIQAGINELKEQLRALSRQGGQP